MNYKTIKNLLIMIALVCTSCASTMFPNTERHNTQLYITEQNNQDTTCVRDYVMLSWHTKMMRSKIPFSYVSSKDTIRINLEPATGNVFTSIDSLHAYQVSFATRYERSLGYLLKIQIGRSLKKGKRFIPYDAPDRILTIGLSCYNK